MAACKKAGVNVILSLLTAPEIADLELQAEPEYCQELGIEYLSHPVRDMHVPESPPEALALIGTLEDRLNQGNNVVIHCWGGIGRSSVVAACLLICHAMTLEAAFDLISSIRGHVVPENHRQREWVEKLVPALTDRASESLILPRDSDG
jgi:protein-tyrosine phosphatase